MKKSRINTNDLIDELVRSKRNAPDTVSLWSKVVDTFGGQDNFAVAAKRVFDSCESGSAQQVRMMSMFMDLCKTASVVAESENPADNMTAEELNAAIGHFLGGEADNVSACESNN